MAIKIGPWLAPVQLAEAAAPTVGGAARVERLGERSEAKW